MRKFIYKKSPLY